MRTTQDRIMLLLSFFGEDRIKTLFDTQELMLMRGRLFGMRTQTSNNMDEIARFKFSDSIRPEDVFYFSDRDKFCEPLDQISNDESKYLIMHHFDQHLQLQGKDDSTRIKLYNNNIPFFTNLFKKEGFQQKLPDVCFCLQEFQGIVTTLYRIRFVHTDPEKELLFNASSIENIAEDSLFKASANAFLEQTGIDVLN